MIAPPSFTPAPRLADVLPTGVEPTGVEPTGVEPTGTSWSVSGDSAWPAAEKPTPLSSIGVEPTGVEPTGEEKNDGAAGALIVRSRSASDGHVEEGGDPRARRQAVELHLVEGLLAAERDVPATSVSGLISVAVDGSLRLRVLVHGDRARPSWRSTRSRSPR